MVNSEKGKAVADESEGEGNLQRVEKGWSSCCRENSIGSQQNG